MKVIYSIGSKFGGHGIGAQAAHAVRSIHRARALKKVLASYQGKTKIPKKYIKTMGVVGKGLRRLAYYDPTGYGYVLHDNIFDRWASSKVESCDIFHGWNHHCLQQLKKAKKLGAVTVVERASSHILQGQEILRSQLWPKSFVEKCLDEYEEADYILVPSDYAKESFISRGFDPERIIKIPFGVDVRKFKIQRSASGDSSNLEKLKVAVQSSKFVVLCVGEIRLGKGVQYLLEAWDALKLKDAELWLAGEEKKDIKRVLSKYRDCKDIKRLGFVRDIPELMGQANVFAFPSLDEGSALVTYEAMAAGLPVVTTPNAGSLVRDSLDGYIIPIKDSTALAERLHYFYRYPEQAKTMGESGRERIKSFTWERYGEELVKAYIRMLKSI